MTSRANFLEAVSAVTDPMLLVYGADTPAKSRAEMEALAGLPNVRSIVLPAGKLAVHEEFAKETARRWANSCTSDEPRSAGRRRWAGAERLRLYGNAGARFEQGPRGFQI